MRLKLTYGSNERTNTNERRLLFQSSQQSVNKKIFSKILYCILNSTNPVSLVGVELAKYCKINTRAKASI